MQGIVFDIKRFTVHDGPGIRTTVFFKGCPLNCFWCHNPESIGVKPFETTRSVQLDEVTFSQQEEVGKFFSVESIMTEIRKDQIFMEESDGGVTFSGGEPTLQPEFLLHLLLSCKSEGLHTAVDTCGHSSKLVFQRILPYTDLFLFDIKHHDPEKHQQATGQSNETIIDNLRFIMNEKKKVRIRIPVIPQFNDSESDMHAVARLLQSLPGQPDEVNLLPFHTLAQSKYQRFGLPNTMKDMKGIDKTEISSAKVILENYGFNTKIGG